MKVLFATSWFPSKLNPTNGNFVERHLHAVKSAGHEVAVVHVEYSHKVLFPSIDKREIDGSKIYQLYMPRLFNKNRRLRQSWYTKFFRALAKDGFSPEIIHGHVFFPIAELVGLAANRFQVPVAFTEHWSGYREVNLDRYTLEVKSLIELAVAHTNIILPVSHDLEKIMRMKGLDGNYHIVNNAVDTNIFSLVVLPKRQFTFLHISNFDTRSKNTEGIIRAFSKLNIHDCRLVIAGDGDLSRLERFMLENAINLDNIELKGTLTYEEVASEMNQSDCHVLFSNFENLPCVISESHCSGVPVIATSVGGIPEMVDATNGILIEAKDETALEKAMEKMISGVDDYSPIGIAKVAASRYGYEAIGDAFTQVYLNLLQHS